MKYLLDANAWIALFRQKSLSLLHELERHAESEIALCSVVLGELCYGAIRSGPVHEPANRKLIDQVRNRYASLPFDDAASEEYAQIRAFLANAGQMIGANDLMIAAIARANGLIVVTHNTGEFGRVPNLAVENWQAP